MGINSSQIHEVPHSATQSVLRNKNAPRATGLRQESDQQKALQTLFQ